MNQGIKHALNKTTPGLWQWVEKYQAVWITALAVWFSYLVVEIELGGRVRLVVAGTIGLVLGLLALTRPRLAIAAAVIYLALMGEIRRLLLYYTGWSGFDPLMLIGPGVAILLASQIFLSHDRLRMTRLSWAILILMGVMAVQVVNPLQGGLLVGIGGMIFYLMPLLWFWVGREYGTPAFMERLFTWAVLPAAIVGALMGIYQVMFGFLPHQAQWIKVAGYAALMVGDSSRPFSVFTSSAEFAGYMNVAAIALIAAALVRRQSATLSAAILLVPLLFVAMFLQGSRGAVVTLGFSAVVAWALLAKDVRQWALRLGAGLVLVAGLGYWGLSSLNTGDFQGPASSLVAHQVGGLTDPMNPKESTASMHVSMMFNGFFRALKNPAGSGLGATTLAAAKFGEGGGSTEVDASDMFVSLGLVGGILYLAVIIGTLKHSIVWWLASRSALALAVVCVLVLTLGGWLRGGNYSLMPLIWLSVGAIDRQWAIREAEPKP